MRREIMIIPTSNMSGCSTAQVARIVGVTKITLLRWLYAGVLKEPKRVKVVGGTWRIWTEADIRRAKQVKKTMKRGPKPKTAQKRDK